MSISRVFMTGFLASVLVTAISLFGLTTHAEAAYSIPMAQKIMSQTILGQALVSPSTPDPLLSYHTILQDGQESLLLAKQAQKKKATKKKATKKNGNKGKHKGQTQGKRKGHDKQNNKKKATKKKATKKKAQ